MFSVERRYNKYQYTFRKRYRYQTWSRLVTKTMKLSSASLDFKKEQSTKRHGSDSWLNCDTWRQEPTDHAIADSTPWKVPPRKWTPFCQNKKMYLRSTTNFRILKSDNCKPIIAVCTAEKWRARSVSLRIRICHLKNSRKSSSSLEKRTREKRTRERRRRSKLSSCNCSLKLIVERSLQFFKFPMNAARQIFLYMCSEYTAWAPAISRTVTSGDGYDVTGKG